MAHDQPGRIERIALGEATIPGVSTSPPLLPDDRWLSGFLWHFNFNRALGVNEALVQGREEIYFGHQFATKSGSPEALPRHTRDFYIEQLRDPDALRASFDYYRAIDASIPQNRERMQRRLTLPMLAFSGELACGDSVEAELRMPCVMTSYRSSFQVVVITQQKNSLKRYLLLYRTSSE